MCFLLYAGTDKPLPIGNWTEDAPGVCVSGVNQTEPRIAQHFTKPVVQELCSTVGCGCDFPHRLLYNGQLPDFDEDDDPQEAAIHRRNREGLVALLRDHGETTVELYGFWVGNGDQPPSLTEEISLQQVLDPKFGFGEQILYRVRISERV